MKDGSTHTMDHVDERAAARKLRLALNMYEVGERFQRQRLRRAQPTATDAEIENQVRAWRESRPGAAESDGYGRPSARFA